MLYFFFSVLAFHLPCALANRSATEESAPICMIIENEEALRNCRLHISADFVGLLQISPNRFSDCARTDCPSFLSEIPNNARDEFHHAMIDHATMNAMIHRKGLRALAISSSIEHATQASSTRQTESNVLSIAAPQAITQTISNLESLKTELRPIAQRNTERVQTIGAMSRTTTNSTSQQQQRVQEIAQILNGEAERTAGIINATDLKIKNLRLPATQVLRNGKIVERGHDQLNTGLLQAFATLPTSSPTAPRDTSITPTKNIQDTDTPKEKLSLALNDPNSQTPEILTVDPSNPLKLSDDESASQSQSNELSNPPDTSLKRAQLKAKLAEKFASLSTLKKSDFKDDSKTAQSSSNNEGPSIRNMNPQYNNKNAVSRQAKPVMSDVAKDTSIQNTLKHLLSEDLNNNQSKPWRDIAADSMNGIENSESISLFQRISSCLRDKIHEK